MKARRICIDNYQTADGKEYEVVTSIVNLLLHPMRRLNGAGLLAADKVADAFRAAGERTRNAVLLDKADYEELAASVNAMRGFGPHDVRLVQAILEAPEIEVTTGEIEVIVGDG